MSCARRLIVSALGSALALATLSCVPAFPERPLSLDANVGAEGGRADSDVGPDAATGAPDTLSATGHWTPMPLLDQKDQGANIMRATLDSVSAIYFESPERGYVGTYYEGGDHHGGAIFRVNDGRVATMVADGTELGDRGPDSGPDLGFNAFVPLDDGRMVAMTDQIGTVFVGGGGADVLARWTTGDGFAARSAMPLGFFTSAKGTWWTADNRGHLYWAATSPDPHTHWTDVTPTPRGCREPSVGGRDLIGQSWHPLGMSHSGETLMYTMEGGICRSVDGGNSWATSPPILAAGSAVQPDGVLVLDDHHAVSWASTRGYAVFMSLTSDAGSTWMPAQLPVGTNGPHAEHEIHDVAFAPSGRVGWVVGQTSGQDAKLRPTLWKTTDGGTTWLDITEASFATASVALDQAAPFRTVFALDEDHLWIGGDGGLLLHHDRGGLPAGVSLPPVGPPDEVPSPRVLTGAIAISAATEHTCAVMDDHSLKCWGANDVGQLGQTSSLEDPMSTRCTAGTQASNGFPVPCEPRPVTVMDPDRATVLLAGSESYTCAVLADGQVACWGLNDYGQLGDGTTANAAMPVIVKGVADVVALASGSEAAPHTCALIADGTVRCWGSNQFGQLGDGSTKSSPLAVTVAGLTGATAIAAGRFHTCALVERGRAYCWGSNGSGQLGDGSGKDSTLPVAVAGVAGASALAAGYDHSCAVVMGGEVMCWGRNLDGALGRESDEPTTAMPVAHVSGATAVAAGAVHTCALLSDGSVECWGGNGEGQLGNGFVEDVPSWGARKVEGLMGAASAVSAAGGWHTCALLAGGSIQCWGANDLGQLGDGREGATSDSPRPVSVLAN